MVSKSVNTVSKNSVIIISSGQTGYTGDRSGQHVCYHSIIVRQF